MADIMDFMTEPAKMTEGFHGIVYGESGCGKTSTLDDPNYKVAHIDLEGGSSVLVDAKNVKRWDVPQIAARTKKHEFHIINEIGAAIRAGKFKDFDLVGIDSLTRYQEILKDYIANELVPNRKREIADTFGAQSDWGNLMDLLSKTFRAFHSLTKRGSNSMNILWLAHATKETDEITKKILRTKVQLQGTNNADIVQSIVDGYFYMYNKPITEEQTVNGKKVTKVTGIERGILTMKSSYFDSKARISKHRDPLPEKIVSPVWSEIFKMMGYDKSGEAHE